MNGSMPWINMLMPISHSMQPFSLEENLSLNTTENLTGRLAAMGLLGYDLDDNEFFYRRLPFKLSRI
jgi:hypothetical protein